jgi:hypothetical protein
VVLRDACFSSSSEHRAFFLTDDLAAAVLATRDASRAIESPCISCHKPSKSPTVDSCSCCSFNKGTLALLLISTAPGGMRMSVNSLHGTVKHHARFRAVLLLSAVLYANLARPAPNQTTP